MTEPASVLAPDSDVMARFLEHAFGGYLDGLHDGLVEIACSINQGDKPNERWWSRLFGTDELDDAVAYATEQNSKHGINLYFAPALRDKASPRNERGNKAKVIGTLLLWCEWDDEKSFNSAKEKFTFAKPTAGELTGVIPEKRAQAFWRLKTAIVGNDEIDAAVNGLCVALGGDPKVVHADCLMRLPGSISWRKLDKPERQDEMTRLEIGKEDRPPAYAVEQILQAYPPRDREGAGQGYAAPSNLTRNSSLGLGGAVIDGRESYMRDTVLACLIEFVGLNGAAPTVDELFAAVWPQYSANVDFSRPGRGADEVRLKCVSTVKRFTAGRITGLWSLEDAVAAYAKKKSAGPSKEDPQLVTADDDDEPFPASSLRGVAPAREWLVPDWLPAGYVTSLYGDGGTGKSLLAMQLANCVAAGQPWLGHEVTKGRVLGVFAEDDKNELHRRQDDIKALGSPIGNNFDYLDDLHLWPRVGKDNLLQVFEARKLINLLTPFYEKLAARIERIRPILTIIDTAADFYGGDEIIRSQVNHFIKATLGSFCAKYRCTILMLAHPSRAGTNSGAGDGGSTAWNNAVRSRWYLTKPEAAINSDIRILTRQKANYAAAGKDQKIDLIWQAGAFHLWQSPSDRLPPDMLKDLLQRVNQAFDEGNPFGANPQSKRPLLPWMMKTYEMTKEHAKQWQTAWISNGVLVSDRANRDSKREGLRVAKWPD